MAVNMWSGSLLAGRCSITDMASTHSTLRTMNASKFERFSFSIFDDSFLSFRNLLLIHFIRICFQEHLLKPAAFVKHIILEELTSIGDILSQKVSGLYFVCTGEYDPKEKKFYLLSAKHPKSLHQLSCVEETFKCGATRMIFVAQYSRAVEKSIRNFAVSLLRRSTPSAKKAVFSRITAPLTFLFIVLNDAVNNGHAIYDNWFSGSLSPSFKHKWFFPDLTHFAPAWGNSWSSSWSSSSTWKAPYLLHSVWAWTKVL